MAGGGGRTALMTASHWALADRVAGHLGLFDEVHGADGSNLKEARKASSLEERFDAFCFDHVGDARSDLPVWDKAHRAVTVGASRALRARLAGSGREAEHLAGPGASLAGHLRALRPHQWLKNLLVLLPLLAAHRPGLLLDGLLAFAAFSLVASGVYVLNDLLDLRADRAHPRKRHRPFASGAEPIAHGTLMAPLLLGFDLLVGLPLGGGFVLALACYWLATTACSLRLKRVAILDIAALAGFHPLSIVAGGLATGARSRPGSSPSRRSSSSRSPR